MPCAELTPSGSFTSRSVPYAKILRRSSMCWSTGAQVNLVRAGPLPPDSLTATWWPFRLKAAKGQYMVERRKEADIMLIFLNHFELSRDDLGKEVLVKESLYKV